MQKLSLLFLSLASFINLAHSQDLVKDIIPGTNSSYPFIMGDVPNGMVFYATTAAAGSELWFTNGTSSGCKLIKDINPGASGSSNGGYTAKIGNNWFFVTRQAGLRWALWKTDGTETGTEMLKDLGQVPVSGNPIILMIAQKNTLFFSHKENTTLTGKELWKSDGTPGGTIMVKDINPLGDSEPVGFVSLGNYVYFFANDGTNGNELWRSNGTDTGTKMVKDIFPGATGSYPSGVPSLMVFKDKLYFGAQGTHDEGNELYVSDGTAAGTKLFKDINTISGAASFPTPLITTKDFLFFRASDGSSGIEPWISDGTPGGTKLLKDINPGTANSTPYSPAVIDNKIVFDAQDVSTGTELWVTDGTPGGTQILKDISKGTGSSYPSNKILSGKRLLFPASDTTYGLELWETDGTPGGTKLYKDINPGKPGSAVTGLFIWGADLYFGARKDSLGSELYKMKIGSSGGSVTKVFNHTPLVYPNPVVAGQYLNIQYPGVFDISILGTDGRMVYTGKSSSGETSLKLPDTISSGIYILRLQNNSEMIVQKIHILD